jgi:hypothetical protein
MAQEAIEMQQRWQVHLWTVHPSRIGFCSFPLFCLCPELLSCWSSDHGWQRYSAVW